MFDVLLKITSVPNQSWNVNSILKLNRVEKSGLKPF